MFSGRHLARLEEIMRAVCADFETGLAEFSGQSYAELSELQACAYR